MTFVIRAITPKNTFVYVTSPTLTIQQTGYWCQDISQAHHFPTEDDAQQHVTAIQTIRQFRTLMVIPAEDTPQPQMIPFLPTIALRDLDALADSMQDVLHCSRREAVTFASIWRLEQRWPIPGRNHAYHEGAAFTITKGARFLSTMFPLTWHDLAVCAWICETRAEINEIAEILALHFQPRIGVGQRPILLEIRQTVIHKNTHGMIEFGLWRRV